MALLPSIEEFITPLLAGNRPACREVVQRELERTGDASGIHHELILPAIERVERLYRTDRINTAAEHMAVRILRMLADQLQPRLPSASPNGRRMIVACADGEPEELGAQITVDLFESRGWQVFFLGGGVPNDEILTLIGQLRPDLLLIFGTQPQGVPAVRKLVDLIREVGVHPSMNIMVSGGVFNRADGLWKEVNADLFAKTATQAIPLAEASKPREAVLSKNGTPKRRRRRRRAAEPETVEV